MFDLVPFRRRNGKVERQEEPFNYLFSNFFDLMDNSNFAFKTDIKETDREYILQAELPGMSRDDINIELEDNYLRITAENNQVVEEEKDNYIRKERRTGSYCRTFNIENIKVDEIDAKYNDGILEVTLPKAETVRKNKRVIDIH